MIEKVNPAHPDKIADRIAGAIVDQAYYLQQDPKVAVEVLIGHGDCHIIVESSCEFDYMKVYAIVKRIAGEKMRLDYREYRQDSILAKNQEQQMRCADNGIFKGLPLTNEQKTLSAIAKDIYTDYKSDGKYILDRNKLIICQSNTLTNPIDKKYFTTVYSRVNEVIVNPLGNWTGGTGVDTGATNRKLGSDMADSVTGGGLHGKDLSKADVSCNIYAFLKAQATGKPVMFSCAIGDTKVDGRPFYDVVQIARTFVKNVGGFEKLAEWGLF